MTNPHPSGVHHALVPLIAPIKDYAWGSTTLLPELTGQPVTNKPQAEMWFGTHPTTPTRLADGTALADVVDLPFLVKLLAAEQPLSIQAHPTIQQAQAGFAAEEAAGIALTDPTRTYQDANHKPEMLVALTDFTAMAGFRQPSAAAHTFRQLGSLVPEQPLATALQEFADLLAAGDLKTVFGRLVDPHGPFWQPGGWTRTIFQAVQHSGTADPYLTNALDAATIHPDDPGALVTLLMNLVQLSEGQALFIPAGTIHAYVAGLGLEVMATSDNVIRGGLTVKHVDVEELNRVVDFQPCTPPRISPAIEQFDGVVVSRFTPPVQDFALTRYDLPAGATITVTTPTPKIAVNVRGTTVLRSTSDRLDLSPGAGAFLSGQDGPLQLTAQDTDVTIFMACQP